MTIPRTNNNVKSLNYSVSINYRKVHIYNKLFTSACEYKNFKLWGNGIYSTHKYTRPPEIFKSKSVQHIPLPRPLQKA